MMLMALVHSEMASLANSPERRSLTAPLAALGNKQPLKALKAPAAIQHHGFCEIFTLLLTTVHTVKSKVKISQNFVTFSEYMNFIIFTTFLYVIKIGSDMGAQII